MSPTTTEQGDRLAEVVDAVLRAWEFGKVTDQLMDALAKAWGDYAKARGAYS